MNDSLFARRCVRWSAFGLCLMLVAPRPARAQGADDANADDAARKVPPAPAAAEAPKAEPAAAEVDDAAAADAELEAEEKASAAKSQKPPPKGKGVIWGTVTDTKFDEAIVEAQVQVQGRKDKTFADIDGRYRLELLPGKYNLRVTYELHRPSRVEVVVKAGELTHVDFKLVPDEGAVEEVVVEESVDHASSEGQTLERKRSSAVGDGVGRAEIARTPDRNAAEAAQRVVGATIVGGRFVFVRGLGERYTNALLNGGTPSSGRPATGSDSSGGIFKMLDIVVFPCAASVALVITSGEALSYSAESAYGSRGSRDVSPFPVFVE